MGYMSLFLSSSFFKTVWSLQSKTTEGSLFSCWCFGFQSKKGSSCMVRQTSAIRIFGPIWWKRRSEYDELLKFYISKKNKKNSLIFPKSHIPVHVNYDLNTVKQDSKEVLRTSRLIFQYPTFCISLLWFC